MVHPPFMPNPALLRRESSLATFFISAAYIDERPARVHQLRSRPLFNLRAFSYEACAWELYVAFSCSLHYRRVIRASGISPSLTLAPSLPRAGICHPDKSSEDPQMLRTLLLGRASQVQEIASCCASLRLFDSVLSP